MKIHELKAVTRQLERLESTLELFEQVNQHTRGDHGKQTSFMVAMTKSRIDMLNALDIAAPLPEGVL